MEQSSRLTQIGVGAEGVLRSCGERTRSHFSIGTHGKWEQKCCLQHLFTTSADLDDGFAIKRCSDSHSEVDSLSLSIASAGNGNLPKSLAKHAIEKIRNKISIQNKVMISKRWHLRSSLSISTVLGTGTGTGALRPSLEKTTL
jgi:hypothetical protein